MEQMICCKWQFWCFVGISMLLFCEKFIIIFMKKGNVSFSCLAAATAENKIYDQYFLKFPPWVKRQQVPLAQKYIKQSIVSCHNTQETKDI